MKIVILGAGHTGSSVARSLTDEGNDVVVIDINSEHLRELQDKVDIATVVGAGTYPDSLQRANMQDADMLIAVMQRDEDNITACQIAWILFQPPLIIARIRNGQYLNYPELFTKNNIPIDALISPESLVTRYVQGLIEYPGIHQLHDFSNATLKLVTQDIEADTRGVGMNIRELNDMSDGIQWVGLLRNSYLLPADDVPTVAEGDRIFYLVSDAQLTRTISLFKSVSKPYKRIILAGGGYVGKRLAIALQDKFKVKIIEKNTERASHISENLEKTMVLCGDATDRDLLMDEGINETDVFCALTSSDEANILSSMLAKKLGVRETICLVNKMDYVDMIADSAIDTVFSPEKITSASILRYVRKGGVINVCPIHGSSLEALEIVVEGNKENSRVIGLSIDQLDLPEDVQVMALIRDEQVLSIPDLVIETRDHLILLVPVKLMASVEKYFHVVV